MKDIGLGILDPYTVVIVLVTLVLANVLFGYQIPIDTTTAPQLFISLVVFTGYIYLARSVVRLPIAAIKSWIITKDRLQKTLLEVRKYYRNDSWLLRFFIPVFAIIVAAPIAFLMYLTSFAEKDFDEKFPSKKIKSISENGWIQYALGFLDRISVVLITLGAVIPAFQVSARNIGVLGIVFMVGVFFIKGSFVALIEDGLVKIVQKVDEKETQNDKKDSVQESEDYMLLDTNYYPGKASEYLSSCEVCGKICAKNEYGRFPRLCSLECRQKWFTSWNHDWCIGDGYDRQMLNSLRSSGYSDYSEQERVIKIFADARRNEAVWALMAIARDSCRIFHYSNSSNIQEGIIEILKNKIQDMNEVTIILNACLIDENTIIANIAAQVLSAHLLFPQLVSINHVKTLLNCKNETSQCLAIELLGKLGKTNELLVHLGKAEDAFVDRAIIDALSSMNPPAIDALKIAEKFRDKHIHIAATEALGKLGLASKVSRNN